MSNYIKEAVDGDGNCCDDCSRTDPCDSCNTPSVAVTCTSWTATPQLCGISAYTDPNAGPTYKWKTETFAGGLLEYSNECKPTCPTAGDGSSDRWIYAGARTLDCTGTLSDTRTMNHGATPVGDCGSFTDDGAIPASTIDPPYGTIGAACGAFTWLLELTQTEKKITGCACSVPGGYVDEYAGEATQTLSDPDSVEDAIARAEPTEGTECCAITGAMDVETEAGSDAPISLGISTKVTLAVVLHGVPSTTYTVRIYYTNAVNSSGSPLADTSEDIEITTDGSGDATLDVDIPQPDVDRKRCFDGAEILT